MQRHREVIAAFGEAEVRAEQQAALDRADGFAQVVQRQIKVAEDQQRNAQNQQGGNDAAGAGGVETEEGKVLLLHAIDDDAGHQEAGNDEEHVYADESALKPWHLEMKQHDREHGQCPQGVDTLPELHLCVHVTSVVRRIVVMMSALLHGFFR